MTIGPLAVRSESLTGFPSVPLSVKSGAFSPTASAAAEPAQPSVRTSPAINISRLRMNPSKARGSLLRSGLDGLLHERSIHDSLEPNRASHEAIVRPPLHLPLDICHEQTGVPVLKREAEPDHLGSGVSILRGSPDDLVVVGAGSGSTVFLDQHGVVIVARGLEVAPHERRRPLAISSELLRVEHRDGLPRVEIAGPEEDLAEALRLRRAGKGLGKQDGVDLSALERLDGGRHGLERNHPDVLELEPGLLEDIAERIVEGGAEGGDADTLALEVGDLAQAAVVELLLDHDTREGIAGPLAPLVGYEPELLAAQDDVVEGGGDAGGSHLDLPGGEGGGDGGGGLEEDELGVDPVFLEEAFVHADEEGRRGAELERADLDGGAGARGGDACSEHRDTEDQDEHDHPPPPESSASHRHYVWRHGTASRSQRVSTQCDSTPSTDRQTMPTMSLVVSMILPAWSTRKPMPESAAIISAATRRRRAVPAPSLSPAKIMGRADGRMTLRMTLHRPAPNAMAARTSRGSACLT